MDLLKKLKAGASKAADAAQQAVSKAADVAQQTVSKAADVAQQTVELTKLAAQVTVRKREIEKLYAQIGEAVYEAHRLGDPSRASERVAEWCKAIDDLNETIATLERQMRYLRRERICRCGKTVPAGARFCPHCGRPAAPETEREAIELIPEPGPDGNRYSRDEGDGR